MTEQMKCPNCGGNINPRTLICEYCGTTFKNETPQIAFTYSPARCEIIQNRIVVDDEELDMVVGDTKFTEFIIHKMAEQMADQLIPFMDIQTMHDPRRFKTDIHTRLRVVRPDYRF